MMAELGIDLYRALKSSSIDKKRENRDAAFESTGGIGSLHPNAGDVTTYKDDGDVEWVRGVNDRDASDSLFVSKEEGVSTSATLGVFAFQGWCYFLLPKTTEMPAGLDALKTPTDKDPEHHSIRCLNSMTLQAFKGALDNFSRAAIAKAVETGRKSLYHSA
jgi:hypothetical protein